MEEKYKYLQSYLKSFVQTQTVDSDSDSGLPNPAPPPAAWPTCSMGGIPWPGWVSVS